MSVYLDNAATSYPKPETVYQAVMHAMQEVGASPGRGGHRRSFEAGRILFMAREAVAKLFSIPDSSRVIFTHSATGALNLALHGTLTAGDHVVTSTMEHNSLLRPLHALQREGVETTIVDAGPDGMIDPQDVEKAVRPNTRMIAIGHVSNVCGAIQPIKLIAEICRQSGAFFLLDAAQSAGYLEIDVVSTGIDLLAAPGHKGLLGPQGTGLLYAAPHINLRSVYQGGTGTSSTSLDQPVVFPDGFEAGTHNLPGIAGLKAGIDFIIERGINSIFKHEQALVNETAKLLGNLDGIKIYGPQDPDKRGSLLSFNVEGVDASLLAAELDHNYDIAVRAGLHCSPLAHQTIGSMPSGTVRMSPGWSSTFEEIAFFSDAVVKCVRKIKEFA